VIDRRRLLASLAAAPVAMAAERAFAQTAAGAAAASPASPQVAAMDALFDGFVQEDLRRYPEGATALGLDTGAMAWTKAALSEVSVAAADNDIALNRERLAKLHAVGRGALTGMDGVNYDVVNFNMTAQDELSRFPWYGGPYVLSQLTGSYQGMPDFLDNQHSIQTKPDADDYLSRMNAFAAQMDGELEIARHDVAQGVTPPDFILDKALIQMRAFHDTPADKAPLVASVTRRTKEKGIAGDYQGEATRLYEEKVRPALGRQIDYLASLRAGAVHDAGVWRMKDGDAFYAAALKQATTSTISPTEVHQTGLDLVAAHQAQIDTLMRKVGLTSGTVGERFAALYKDPKYQYPNTDEGKVQLIADLNVKVQAVTAKLPAWFGVLPTAKLEIHRVPKAIEAGAPGGYYNPPPLDDSRPGIYWINLRDTAEVPKWTLPSLTFHEGIPGHHLQGSIANHSSLPLIRKTIWFSGYGEGWALYAEQLAVEMGMYEDDPLGHIGQLHDSMFRCVRLVVDSGLHSRRWSREQAVKYYVDTLGDKESSAITEVERYCVWPGQACSYMVGKLTWLRLREKAKAALGPRFDIRKFHDAGLLSGPTPLDVLGGVIDTYITTA
jgi:uncharacterized protein (DUF885 family)